MNSSSRKCADPVDRRGGSNDAAPWADWPDNEQPTLSYHIQGDKTGGVFWIDMFSIPRKHRGQGIGGRLWRHFEASIPPKFPTIKLVAADTGDGSSEGFWQKMGFRTESSDRCNGVVMSKTNPAADR